LYGVVLSLKELYPNTNEWNNEIYLNLKDLVNKYYQFIKLEHIGFPDDWEEKLMK